jgi:hypothetical protein
MPMKFSHLCKVGWPSRVVWAQIPGEHGNFSSLTREKSSFPFIYDIHSSIFNAVKMKDFQIVGRGWNLYMFICINTNKYVICKCIFIHTVYICIYIYIHRIKASGNKETVSSTLWSESFQSFKSVRICMGIKTSIGLVTICFWGKFPSVLPNTTEYCSFQQYRTHTSTRAERDKV